MKNANINEVNFIIIFDHWNYSTATQTNKTSVIYSYLGCIQI